VRQELALDTAANRARLEAALEPAESSNGVLRVGDDLPPPRKIADVPPVYPAAAQDARVGGVVILEIVIDETGHVSEARVTRSVPLLDQAAVDAVRQWEYEPTLLNGVPVSVTMHVTVNFTLS
jgi:protein TonB